MKKIFFTPGPAHIYPTVDQHIRQALDLQLLATSHRSQTYMSIHQKAVEGIKALMAIPQDFHIFFHSSATEIWERMIQNVVVDTSFHFVNGSFSRRYFDIATQLGVNAQKEEVAWGQACNLQAAEIAAETELINFTHNETSTGVMLDLEEVYALRKHFPKALTSLDMVSAAPYGQPDWSQIDSAYLSVQKCFGLPAGLGILILSPKLVEKATAKHAAGYSIGSYHSFPSQLSKAVKHQTPETPNILGVYLFGQVCEDMLRIGIDQIRAETDAKAKLLYDYFERDTRFEIFVEEAKYRSKTVIVINTPSPSPLLADLEKQGFVVGKGYGKMKTSQIRIANFPTASIADVERLLATFDKLPI